MKTRFPLSKLQPFLSAGVSEYAKADSEVCRKARASMPTIQDGEERTVVQVISTRDIDRDQEILDPKGCITSEYEANPVVMWAHDYSLPPVAKCVEIKATEDKIVAKAVYSETDFANDIFTLKREGILSAASVGFMPIEYVIQGAPGWAEAIDKLGKRWGMGPKDFKDVFAIHTKWLLLEYSDVPIPSNPQALQVAAKSLSLSLETVTRLNLVDDGCCDDDSEDDTGDGEGDMSMMAHTIDQAKVLKPAIQRVSVRSYSELAREVIKAKQGRLD